MTTWADPAQVENAAKAWTREQLRCRARNRHNWLAHTVTHDKYGYTIVERCLCKSRHQCFMDNDGYATPWKMIYDADDDSPAYLTKGIGRIGVDGRARLRLAHIKNLRVREITE